VKSFTFRLAAICFFLLMARLDASQTVALTLSPVKTHGDSMVRLEVFLNAPSNAAPAGLQWTFRLPPDLNIVEIKAGQAVKNAGKTLVCNEAKCIVYGMNQTTISNGPVAVLKIKVDQGLASGKRAGQSEAHGRARIRRPEIQIGDPVAVSVEGRSITVVPGSGVAIPSNTP
jgi:hypothetical protein